MKEIDVLGTPVGELLKADLCAFFYRLAQELPGEQIVLNLGRQKFMVCQDADSSQTILRENPDNFQKNFGAFASVFGSSRLTTDGDQWRKLHKIGQPLIAGVETEEVIRETQLHYGKAASGILEAAGRSPVVTIDAFIDQAAASVVMKTVLGVDISDLPSHFYSKLRNVLSYCGQASLDYDLSIYADHGERTKVESVLGEVMATINALIADGRNGSRGTHSSLEAFYSAFPSDSEVLGEFCGLLFAGFDTTSSTLCWALMLLANKPALQKQLRRELQEITAGKELTKDLLVSSKTLMALINETFRMFPPVPILSRVAVAKDRVGSVGIQAGQKILLSIIGLHHDCNFWSLPSRMDIGRFPEGDPSGEMRKHLLPFSAGPRMCGGSKFAITELSVALALLLRHLEFEPAEQQPVRFHWGASMRHRDGIRLVVAAHAD